MSSIRHLGKENSLLNHFIAELRSVERQKDSMRFRRNLERVGEVFAYEISKELHYETREVVTPLGIANTQLMDEIPVLATILRAGLPIHQGFLNYFDGAENAFISAFRKHYRDGSFEIQVDYIASPVLDNKILILIDPMLATGKSMLLAYQEMLSHGTPAHVHFVSAIGSAHGISYLQSKILPNKSTIWIGAIDEELTAQSYIVPGLGDAGDLAYGNKPEENDTEEE